MVSNYADLLGMNRAAQRELYEEVNRCNDPKAAVRALGHNLEALGNIMAHLPDLTAEREELYEALVGSVTAERRDGLPADAISRVSEISDSLAVRKAVAQPFKAFVNRHKTQAELKENVATLLKEQLKRRPVEQILGEVEIAIEEMNAKERLRIPFDRKSVTKEIVGRALEEVRTCLDRGGDFNAALEGLKAVEKLAPSEDGRSAMSHVSEAITQNTRMQLQAKNFERFEEGLERAIEFLAEVPQSDLPDLMGQIGRLGKELAQSLRETVDRVLERVDKGQKVSEGSLDSIRQMTVLLAKMRSLDEGFGLKELHGQLREELGERLRQSPLQRFTQMALAGVPMEHQALLMVIPLMAEVRDHAGTVEDRIQAFIDNFSAGSDQLRDLDLQNTEDRDLLLDACKAAARTYTYHAFEKTQPLVEGKALNLANEADRLQKDQLRRVVRELPGVLGLDIDFDLQMQVQNDRLIAVLQFAGFERDAIDAWIPGLDETESFLFEEWVGLNLNNGRIQANAFPDIDTLYAQYRADVHDEPMPMGMALPQAAVAPAGIVGHGLNEDEQLTVIVLQEVLPGVDQAHLAAFVQGLSDIQREMLQMWIQQNEIAPGVFDSVEMLYEAHQAMI